MAVSGKGIVTPDASDAYDLTEDLAVMADSIDSALTLVDTPAGTVTQFAGVSAPGGWLLCRGQEVSRSTYAVLFSVIGTAFGSGNGSSTFNVPNLMGRVPVGVSTSDNDFLLAKTGGAKTHVLTTAQLPAHSHTASTASAGGHTHTVGIGSAGSHIHSANMTVAGEHTHTPSTMHNFMTVLNPSTSTASRRQVGSAGADRGVAYTATVTSDLNSTRNTSPGGGHAHNISMGAAGAHTHSTTVNTAGAHTHTVTVNNTGSGAAHNIMQPFIALNYIIKT